jgi:VWFA-related protein
MVNRRFFAMLLGFMTLGELSGQDQDSSGDSAYDLKIPVNLVLVPVTVEDKGGNLLHSLGKNDFQLLEDGISQKISYFSVDPSPLSVALLIDRTVDEHAQSIFKKNMLALVEAFSSFDEMAFYDFLDGSRKLQDFTFRKEELLKPIAKVNFVPCRIDGLTADAPRLNTSFLDDAISTAAHDLQRRGRNRRKVIFVVSNGVTSGAERQTFTDTRRFLMQNSIVVYGLGAGNSLLFRKIDPLKKYTDSTGGKVFYPWKTGSFSETYRRISETARNQYLLGYVPVNDLKNGGYRSITVRLTRPEFGGRISHRKGYLASQSP